MEWPPEAHKHTPPMFCVPPSVPREGVDGWGGMDGGLCMHTHEGLFTGQSENEAAGVEGVDEAEGKGRTSHLARSLPSK
jgi:hypothetical protein